MSKKEEKKSSVSDYLAEARSWETDKVITAQKSQKQAWTIAAISLAIALIAVIALALLVPLKHVEPFVVRVDNSTGAVDIVSGLADGKANYEEAVNKYFVQWYVRYREGYSKSLAEEYYNNTGLMSGSVEQQKYAEFFTPKNPTSPLNIYGDYAQVKVKVKSTSFINPTVALVRYTKSVERGLDKSEVTHWAATVTFKYTKAPMSEQDRGVNPLGFQVVEYRNDPDVGDDKVIRTDSFMNQDTTPVENAPVLFPGQPEQTEQTQPAESPTVPAIQP